MNSIYLNSNNIELGIKMLREAYINDSDVCFQEYIELVHFPCLSVAEVISVYASLCREIDGDKIIRINEEENINEELR